jgi:hypothetical protein
MMPFQVVMCTSQRYWLCTLALAPTPENFVGFDFGYRFSFHAVYGSTLRSGCVRRIRGSLHRLSSWSGVGWFSSITETTMQKDCFLFSELIALWRKLLYSLGHGTDKNNSPDISPWIRG